MDSVTQIVLGAAVGEAMLGRRVGARAPLWGAICGTLPDLDVLLSFGDAVADFTYHRSFSHSVFVLGALTPLLTWLIVRLHPPTRPLWWRWGLMVYVVFLTHVLLDAFTIYGTQLFWPLDDTPYGLGSVFIIDPLYTVPLLAGLLLGMRWRHAPSGRRAHVFGLGVSSLYLAWGVAVAAQIEDTATRQLHRDGVAYRHLLVTPTPFNSVLWRVVAVGADGYHVGYRSLLDGDAPIELAFHPGRNDLLQPVADTWAVRRLQWFTHGFQVVERMDDVLVVSDLRMGLEPDYVFRFAVAEIDATGISPLASALRVPPRREWTRLSRVWERALDPAAPPP